MDLIKRPLLRKIKKQLKKGKIVFLIGARQVGKTSLLRLLKRDLEQDPAIDSIFYFDLEKSEVLENFVSYKSVINWLKLQGADLNKRTCLLIDEVQYAPNPNKVLKILGDHYPNLSIVATGSSSIRISEKVKESLAGRKRIFKVWPLSFDEFLTFKGSSLADVLTRLKLGQAELVPSFADDLINAWEEFLIFGSYPGVVLQKGKEEKIREIEDIYQSYIQKDIKAFLKLENVMGYNKLIKIIASQVGSLFNFHSISNTVGIARETLERYVYVLEQTFVIDLIPPYFSNKQKEVVKMNKAFFIDPGMRNFALKAFQSDLTARTDTGMLAENGVFSEIKKNMDVLSDLHFWRTQARAEVDFVLKRNGQLIPIEVKYTNLNSCKVPSSLKRFIKIYKPSRAFVINKNLFSKTKFNNCSVQFLPPYLISKELSDLSI